MGTKLSARENMLDMQWASPTLRPRFRRSRLSASLLSQPPRPRRYGLSCFSSISSNKRSCFFCVRRTSDAILSFDACLQCDRPPHLARVPGTRFSCREMASELSSMSCDWEDDGKNLEGNVRYEQAEKQADLMLILIREAVNQNHRRYFLVSSTFPLFS